MGKKRSQGASSAQASGTPDAAALRACFHSQQRPLRLDDLLRVLRLPRRHKRALEERLEALAAEGFLLRLRGGQWAAVEHVRTVAGRYTVQRSGAGFVAPLREQGKEQRAEEDIFIPPFQAGDAWHGDVVRVALSPGRRGKSPEGRIVQVLERGQKEVTVRVLRPEGAFFLCRPADQRLPFLVQVDAGALPQRPRVGDLLLATPEERLASDLWRAAATAVFGREEDVAVQERLVKLNHMVPLDFPQQALAEAALYPADPSPDDLLSREDLRSTPFVTIDGADARDFDDAIHVHAVPGGWVLHVAIADVTHYVRRGSALDAEAQERGNSWYFPASVEPMLPFSLSNGLCSLQPHVDRLVMLAEIRINHAGTPGQARFAQAVIRSAARLTYDQVRHAVLDRQPAAREALWREPRGAEVLAMLEEAERLGRILARARRERGSLDFDLPEPDYVFDAQGRIRDIRCRERHFAHQIIEECMITANEAVARFLEERGVPLLYRVHPQPDADRLATLFRTLASTSLAAALPARADAAALQPLLRAAQGGPQEFLVGRLALRAMPQARYQPDNEGHFGLASGCYCHFTSPIRRYADIVVHRALKRALGLDAQALPAGKRLLILADQLNRRERAAMEAEREMARRLAALFLNDRVGETFTGSISAVTDFGFFVELDAMPVEGMVRIDDLGNEYFDYLPDRQELRGASTGTRYGLGQRVTTRLVAVNMGRLEITLRLADTPEAPRGGERRAPMPRSRISRQGRGPSSRRAEPARRPARHGRKGRRP